MSRFLFIPMFSLVDMITSTVAAILMFNGHWLASVPVLALGIGLAAYARRKGWHQPFYAQPRRKGW